MLNVFSKIVKKDKKKEVDQVYEFFANGKAKDYKKAYNRALRLAQKDQLDVLKRAKLVKG
jgi:hypothetical protein